MELYMGARHFAQSADLYGPIEMKNPATPSVTETYLKTASEVADIVGSGDRDRFRAMFAEVKEFLGPFTVVALEQTSFLIDRLVERT
jgi:chorismate mutase/prephenate dehydrogenase